MGSPSTSEIYFHVIEDVINKVRDEFSNNSGPEDGVLDKLQGLWQLKMLRAGVIMGPITHNPVHDLNLPHEGTEEYETPSVDLLFPPTPLQTPMQSPMPGTTQTITPYEYVSNNENGRAHEMKGGMARPNAFMPPPAPWLNQRPHLDVNAAYVEAREESGRGAPQLPSTQDFFNANGKRKHDGAHHPEYIPQQDGSSCSTSYESKVTQRGKICARIPQLDGPIPDPYDDVLSTPNIYNYQGGVNEDYNIVNTPLPNEMLPPTPTPTPIQNDTKDDDDDLDDVGQGEDVNTTNLILAQFNKVTKIKGRWKCTLKGGVMLINDKEVLFNKAYGEFDF